LLALTERFKRAHPTVEIEWQRRSLKDFGDYPVELLAKEYDIILVDHPHVGSCAEKGTLVPLDTLIPESFLLDQEANSVGLSYESYLWKGHLYALPVDAAAQVASCRPDLLGTDALPATWKQVIELAEALPKGRKIGWPLCPTDAVCSFLSLCADIGGFHFFDEAAGIRPEAGAAAIAQMFELLPYLHESSLSSNPIQMYDHMVASRDIVYVPLAFGYSNYARPEYGDERLRFADIPTNSGVPKGSLLGGVGMAVSSYSKRIPLAVEFAMLTAAPEIQRTVYFQAGGQPAHVSAWRDEDVNRMSGGFFANTWQTLQQSYLRPRNRIFPKFQEQAGILIHKALCARQAGEHVSAAETVSELNGLYRALMKEDEIDL